MTATTTAPAPRAVTDAINALTRLVEDNHHLDLALTDSIFDALYRLTALPHDPVTDPDQDQLWAITR